MTKFSLLALVAAFLLSTQSAFAASFGVYVTQNGVTRQVANRAMNPSESKRAQAYHIAYEFADQLVKPNTLLRVVLNGDNVVQLFSNGRDIEVKY